MHDDDGRHTVSADAASMYVTIEFCVEIEADVDEFHEHGNDVMDELLKLEEVNDDVTDSAVSTDAEARTVTIDLVITNVNDVLAAIGHALDVMRTAVHATGALTPDWPRVSDVQGEVEYHLRGMKTAMDTTLVPA